MTTREDEMVGNPNAVFALVCAIDGSGGGGYWPVDPELIEMYWRDRRERIDAALTGVKGG